MSEKEKYKLDVRDAYSTVALDAIEIEGGKLRINIEIYEASEPKVERLVTLVFKHREFEFDTTLTEKEAAKLADLINKALKEARS